MKDKPNIIKQTIEVLGSQYKKKLHCNKVLFSNFIPDGYFYGVIGLNSKEVVCICGVTQAIAIKELPEHKDLVFELNDYLVIKYLNPTWRKEDIEKYIKG